MKKVLSFVLVLIMAVTVMTAAVVPASAETATGKIYFDTTTADWNNFTYVRFHIWSIDDPDFRGFDWGGKKQQGTDEGSGVWSYDLSTVGGIKSGCQYGVIFYNSNGAQTYNLLFGAECIGKTASGNGVIYENPEDSQKTTQAAFWGGGIDPEEYGPQLMVTSIGNVVGTCVPKSTTRIDLFGDYLLTKLENARTFTDKTDQELLDDTAEGLGLTIEEVEDTIKSTGVTVDWDKSKSTLEGAEPAMLDTPKITSLTNNKGSFTAKWKAVNGAKAYKVAVVDESASAIQMSPWFATTDKTQITYKGVKSGITYGVLVCCFDPATSEATSEMSAVKRIKYIAPPAVKTAVSGYGGVTVTWAKSSGAAKYRVFRKLGSGSWTKLGDTTAVKFVDKKAVSGKKYSYAVRCISKDTKSYTSALSSAKTVTYIAAPTLKSVAKGKGYVKLTWKKPAGAVRYRVFRKTGSGKWTKLGDVKTLSFTDKKVKKNTKYIYTVCCVTANGKTVVSSYNPTGKAIVYK